MRFPALALMLALAGCTGLQRAHFEPIGDARYGAREAPAAVSHETGEALSAQGYARIGIVEVRQELKRCTSEGCTEQSYDEDATTQARRIAAEHGGDLIAMEKDNSVEREPFEQLGRCVVPMIRGPESPSQAQPMTGNEDCLKYETLRGEKFIRVSKAFVWRREPQQAAPER